MIKNYFLLFLVFLLAGCQQKKTVATNANQDSIQKYLDLADNDSLDFDKRIAYNDMAFEAAVKENNTEKNRELLSKIGFKYYSLNSLDKYEKTYKQLLKVTYNFKDSINYGNALRMKAFHLYLKKQNDSSLFYYLKAEKIYQSIDKPREYSIVLFNKGLILFDIGDYNACEYTLIKALHYIEKTDDKKFQFGILNQLGVLYSELNEKDKALFYHLKAFNILKINKIDDKKILQSSCYNNIGFVYLKKKEYKKAILNFNLGLKNDNLKNLDPELYALLYDNLGYSLLKNGNYEKALKFFQKALEVKKEIKYLPVLINIYTHFSEYYRSVKHFDLAIFYSELALKEARN